MPRRRLHLRSLIGLGHTSEPEVGPRGRRLLADFFGETRSARVGSRRYAFSPLGESLEARQLLSVAQPSPSAYYVDPSYNSGTSGWQIDHFNTIQAAINADTNGKTINVDAGTYSEQLTIDHSVHIAGAGAGSTVIDSPATLNADANGKKSIVTVTGPGTNAEVDHLTVSGSTIAAGSATIDYGFFVIGGANANIHDDTIQGISDNPTDGAQNGRAIYVGSSALSTTGTATVTNDTVSGYQKGGIIVDNTGSSATITGNTVTGIGNTTLIAQNGVVIENGATASISGNTISGNEYSGASGGPDPLNNSQSCGILLFNAGNGTSITGNTVDGNDVGIYNWTTGTSTISGNTLGGTTANRYSGIFLDSGTATVSSNTVKGGNVGVAAYSFTGNPSNTVGTLTNNVISSATGIQVYNQNASSPTVVLAAHGNDLSGSASGVTSNGPAVDASANYWGTTSGSAVKALANGGVNVDFTPYLAGGTDNVGMPGFTPSYSSLFVSPDGTQTGTEGRIQEAIDTEVAQGTANGGTVNVRPGSYFETATGRTVAGSGSATYQFGIYVGDAASGITIRGVDASNAPITDANNTLASITTNSTANFGPDGVFVQGDNVTMRGLQIGINNNAAGENKTIEVIGNNFSFLNNYLSDPDGDIYLNDFRVDTTNPNSPVSHVQGYTISGDKFGFGASIDVASGAGLSGPVAGRTITNNSFAGGEAWPSISFNGTGAGEPPWFTYSVGGAQITGNTFSGSSNYIRARGTYDNTQFDWKSYFNGNTYARAVADGPDPANGVLTPYSYTSGSYSFANVRQIGGVIQTAVDNAAAGDTVLAKAGAYSENVVVNKKITLAGAGDGSDPATSTVITAANAALPTLKVTAGGTTAADRLVVKNLRVTGSNTAGVLVDDSTGPAISHVTLDTVASVGNDSGVVFNYTQNTGDFILNAPYLAGNNNSGVQLSDSAATFDGLQILGGQITNNRGNGFISGVTKSSGVTNVTISGTAFSGNGWQTGQNFQDVVFYKFHGNAALNNVTVASAGPNGNGTYGIQFFGDGTAPGNVSVNNVTVGGTFRKLGFLIQGYTDVSKFTFSGLDLTGVNGAWAAMAVDHTSATPLNLGNTAFGNLSAVELAVWNTGGIDATGASFNGVSTSTASLSQLFADEDQIVDGVDAAGLGLVRLRAGNVYVTPNSFVGPATATKLQNAVNVASPGDTIVLQNGTYKSSNTLLSNPVTVQGQSTAGVIIAPSLADDHTDSSFGGTVSNGFVVNASNVTVQGLTIDGNANPGLAGSQNFRNGIITNYVGNTATAFGNVVVNSVAVDNVYRKGIGLYNVGTNHSTGDVIANSTFDHVGTLATSFEAYGAIAVFQSDTTITNNAITNSGAGILANSFNTAAQAPKLTVTRNSFSLPLTTSSNPVVAMDLASLAAGSVIGSATTSVNANTIDTSNHAGSSNNIGVVVSFAAGPVTVGHNTITQAGNDTGIYLYYDTDPSNPVKLVSNTVKSSGTGTASPAAGQGAGVYVTDSGSFFNGDPAAATYATLTGNDIENYPIGVELNRLLTGNTVSVTSTGSTIKNSILAGIDIQDAVSPASTPVTLTADSTTTVTSNVSGAHGAIINGLNASLVDTYTPTGGFTSTPSNPSFGTSASFGFTGSDNITSLNDFKAVYQLDGGSAVTTTNNPFTVNGLSVGSHTLTMVVKDQAGNPSSSSSYTWIVQANPASFVKSDTTTQGNWKAVYGVQGYDLAKDPSTGDTPSLPAGVSVTVSNAATPYAWTSATTDPRALQQAATGSTGRVAPAWYAPGNFSIDIQQTGTHQVALYLLDWDNAGRTETVQVIEDAHGTVVDTQTLSSGFQGGTYLVWNLTGNVTLKVTATGASNAVASALFFGGPPPVITPTASASAPTTDTATKGTWIPAYGSDGFSIAQDPSGNNPKTPSYVSSVTATGTPYAWNPATSDPRALQQADGSNNRIASAWYGSTVSFDVKMKDSATHQIALYALDWDNAGRTETVTLVDDATGLVLNNATASLSNFGGGTYLVWNVAGSVTVKVTNTGPTNAVASALFFGGPPPVITPTASASAPTTDTATKGTWIPAYGSDGFSIAQDPSGNNPKTPSYVSSVTATGTPYAWNPATSDPRALQQADGSNNRIASAWYGSTVSFDVKMKDSATHQIALYALDWDNAGRTETVTLVDDATGLVLNNATASLSNFGGGTYLVWNVAGSVTVKVTNTGPTNAVASALFFGGPPPVITPTASASFVKTDITTEGNWIGAYGSAGFTLPKGAAGNDPSTNNPTTPPFLAAPVTLASGDNPYTWIGGAQTTDQRALQQADGTPNRVASTWYASTTLSYGIQMTGGTHQLSLYALDWDMTGRSETVQIIDSGTGIVLDTKSVNNFSNGEYLVWNVSGNVTVKVTNTGPANAVISGLFFD